MKKLVLLVLILGMYACGQDKDDPKPTEFGFLSMGISLDIEQEEANGRVATVNTGNFLVIIYDNTGVVVESYDPFTTAPAQIKLPVGEYYITASSNDLVDAAFESPYYFGQSANFTIDKLETKTIDVPVSLANSKVTINYSPDLTSSFTTYTGEVTVVNTGSSLFFSQIETRPGYFVSGGPLEVVVSLSYVKLDGSTIDRSLSTVIAEALPKTQYNVNVDAFLEDGEISINIILDETFDEVDVELSEFPASGTFIDDRDGQEYRYLTIGNQVWMAENLNATVFADGTPVPTNQMFTGGNPAFGVYYNFIAATRDGSASDTNPSGVQGVCPNGWHLPSLAEYNELANALGGGSVAGAKMRSTSTLWNPATIPSPEPSGFDGEPNGLWGGSAFSLVGDFANWWTSSELDADWATGRNIRYNADGVSNSSARKTAVGYCVRCVKD